MDPSILWLLIIGFCLVIGSAVSLTTFGKKRPVAALIAIFTAFAAYISIILIRIGVIDMSWLTSGGG